MYFLEFYVFLWVLCVLKGPSRDFLQTSLGHKHCGMWH